MQNTLDGFESYLRGELGYSEGTITRYLATAHHFGDYLSANRKTFRNVKRHSLSQFLRGQKASRSGWNNRLAALRALYGYLIINRAIKKDPLQTFEKQQVFSEKRVPLSLEEILQIIEAAEKTSPKKLSQRNKAIIVLLFHSALRVSELSQLDLRQLDLQGHNLLSVRTKGHKRQNTPLSDLVVGVLEGYLGPRAALLGGRNSPALFLSLRGTR